MYRRSVRFFFLVDVINVQDLLDETLKKVCADKLWVT